jgi:hypothetical protein
MDMIDKGQFQLEGEGVGWHKISSQYAEHMQGKVYELFIFGISHLMFLNCSWPRVAETLE